MKLLFAVRNVAAHADEMAEAAPAQPVFFQKPTTSLQEPGDLVLPTEVGRIEFEAELAVEVGSELTRADAGEAGEAISKVGVVLDLTARELQAQRKAASLPWFEAKGFDGACVLGPLVRAPAPVALGDLWVWLAVNGEERQRFRVADYSVQPAQLLAQLSEHVTLEPGDVLGCGTGAGVGPLFQGDTLDVELEGAEGTAFEAVVGQGPER